MADRLVTPQKQTITHHYPKRGQYADCLRACVASLLDRPIEEVPNFAEGVVAGDAQRYLSAIREWLAPERILWVTLAAGDLEQVLDGMEMLNSGQRWILLAGAKQGINHAVCCKGGVIEHDPSTRDAITGPMWPARQVFGVLTIGERL